MFNETVVRKWNYETHDYDPYEVPKDWYTPLVNYDMDKLINCINCGKEVAFGVCYTSKVYHNLTGFGFNVCPDCHEEEMKVEKEYERR